MSTARQFIKSYFSTFAFFYRYIGNKIFIIVISSLAVSILDGFGLSMFLPLLQTVGGTGVVDAEQLGALGFIVEFGRTFGVEPTVGVVLMVMVVFFILKGIGAYIKEVYNVVVQHSFIRNLRLILISAVDCMAFKHFISADAGRIQNTVSIEVDRISMGFQFYFNAFQQALMVMVYLGFAFLVDWQFAALVAIGGALTNFLYKIIYSKTEHASVEVVESGHIYQGLLLQHLTNFKYLKATGRIKLHAEKINKEIRKIEQLRRKMGSLAAVGSAAREPLLMIVIAAVILIQIKLLEGDIGAILISLLFFYRALGSLMGMQQSWNSFLSVSGSLKNMAAFQQEMENAEEKSGTVEFSGFKEKIFFEKVGFAFDKTVVLQDITFNICKNESTAFVGESGSGKTTVANIIAGLLNPVWGHVEIDDYRMSNLQIASYQQKVGYITQEPVIFNDTIYNNVTFWAEKSQQNMNRFKMAIAQSSLQTFLQDLPEGAETKLGNSGLNVSGGQKQRISIARELFKEVDILILDEATSALDSETETSIQQSIERLKGKYTIIIIAHRLSTVRNVDKIVFMNKGHIEAQGSFIQLMDSFPKFRKMVELQGL